MPNEKYIIKKAQNNDVDAIVKLYDAVNDYYDAPGWGKGVYPTTTSVIAGVEKSSLHILFCGDEILGACMLNHEQHPAYALQPWSINAKDEQVIVVHDLVSHPNQRRKGLGKDLVVYSIDFARKCNAVTIRLDTHLSNIPARTLYERCGFKEVVQWTGVILGIQQTFCVFEYLL